MKVRPTPQARSPHVVLSYLAGIALVASGLTIGLAGTAFADNVVGSTVVASPVTVASDGSNTSTITVTLGSAAGTSDNVTLAGTAANSSSINGGSTGALATVNAGSSKIAVFTVTDTVAEAVTYQAIDVTDGDQTITAEPTVTFVAPIISRAATFPVDAESLGLDSETVTTQKAGDLVFLVTQIHSQSITVSSVTTSGAGTTGSWTLAKRYVDPTNSVITEELWSAVVASPGSTTITANFSGSVASLTPELVVDSFTTTNPVTWAFVASGGTAAATVTTVTYPSLTSSSAPDQLYWGYAETTTSNVPGTTPGFVQQQTNPELNLLAYDDALSPSTTYAPTASETSGNTTSIAAIYSATPEPTDTITFNSQGGSAVSAVNGFQGSTITLPAPPTFAGHTFQGWFAASSGGPALTSPYTLAGSTTLFAQWTVNSSFTVTFNANGGTGTMASETDNSPTALTTNSFTNAGFTFAGWNTAANGSGTGYANTATYPFTANATLYAQWTTAGGGGGGVTTTTLVISAGSVSITSGGTVTPTATVSGLATGDTATASGLTYTYAGTGTTTYAASTTAPTAVGTYSITPSGGSVIVSPSADQAKYAGTYTYAAGTLTITAAVTTTPPPPPAPFHAAKVVGKAVVGRTAIVTIDGTGFYGRPRITSSKGTTALVTRDTGKVLTVRVTVKKGTALGTHTFTVILANGKKSVVHFVIK